MELRQVPPERFDAWARTVSTGFGERFRPERVADLRAMDELERTFGWDEDGAWVAGATTLSVRVALPGGDVPGAGVTAVSVLPTHRRRGLLRGLMERVLDQARERAEPLAVLWASEGAIYGRFGFGMAMPLRGVRLRREHGALRADAPSGDLRLAALDPGPASAPRLAAVYEGLRDRRPGAVSRSEALWRHGTLAADPDAPGDRRLVVAEGPDGDEGYVLHRVVDRWDDLAFLPDGTVEVDELVALTPAAEAALWRFVCGIDLMGRVVAPLRPPDDALGHLLADPRRLEARAAEGLWVCVLDAPTALEARTYGREDRLVLDVAGHGRLALEGGPHGARARRTALGADVALPGDVLGALLLGGVAPAAVGAAGRLEERTPGAVGRLHAMLASPLAPWCPFVF